MERKITPEEQRQIADELMNQSRRIVFATDGRAERAIRAVNPEHASRRIVDERKSKKYEQTRTTD